MREFYIRMSLRPWGTFWCWNWPIFFHLLALARSKVIEVGFLRNMIIASYYIAFIIKSYSFHSASSFEGAIQFSKCKHTRFFLLTIFILLFLILESFSIAWGLSLYTGWTSFWQFSSIFFQRIEKFSFSYEFSIFSKYSACHDNLLPLSGQFLGKNRRKSRNFRQWAPKSMIGPVLD